MKFATRLAATLLFATATCLANVAHAQTTDNAQTEEPAPATEEDNTDQAEPVTPRILADPDTLIATDEEKAATAKAKADAEQAAMIAALDAQLLGSWGRISNRGAAGISDASIVTGVNQCLRTRKVSKPDYAEDAEKVLPDEKERRGNLVFYRTESGLQRLDTALRKVLLISKVEKQPVKPNPNVWKLSTTKGSVLLGFGTVRRKGRAFPVLIEQNAVYVRCTASKTTG